MKLYDKYMLLKESDSYKKYLFRAGNFYIFLAQDAIDISNITTLKLTSFGSTVKCGFPLTSLDKYLRILKNIGLEVFLVENKDDIIQDINQLKLDSLNRRELIQIIKRFKRCV